MRTVLVDDSPDFLQVMLAIVDDFNGIEVVGLARDGLNAVTVVEDLHPDLVIMDVNMPSMNGFCAAATILANSPTTQVILMSAEEHSGSFNELTEACGAVALLRKSAIREDLARALLQLARDCRHPVRAKLHE
jgi:two-component system response regulator DegU